MIDWVDVLNTSLFALVVLVLVAKELKSHSLKVRMLVIAAALCPMAAAIVLMIAGGINNG